MPAHVYIGLAIMLAGLLMLLPQAVRNLRRSTAKVDSLVDSAIPRPHTAAISSNRKGGRVSVR